MSELSTVPALRTDRIPGSPASGGIRGDGSLLPLVVGITGHRDLREEDVPALEAAVHEFFSGLRRRLPSTPLVLLTPLAEGADRLAARIFLGIRRADPCHRLVVLLPMPIAEYRKDFASADSLREFEALAGQGEVLQLAGLSEPERVAGVGDGRALLYERVGAAIALHSHLVVALWDGTGNGKMGGTAEVVRFRLEGLPERYLPHPEPLDPPECGSVYHVYTPRALGSSSPSKPAGTAETLYPGCWGTGAAGAAVEAQLLDQLESFNRDAGALLRRHPERIRISQDWILPEAELPGLTRAERHVLRVYSTADALAIQSQRISRQVTTGLLGMGVFAVALNIALADFVKRPELPWVYLGWLLVGAASLWTANRFAWQHRHINYRALAEALRVQLFWRLAALPLSAADAYLRGQREELQGIRRALRFFDLLALGEARPDIPAAVERLRLVRARWVRDQRAYFLGRDGRGGAVAREEQKSQGVSWATRASVALGVLLIVPLGLWPEALETPLKGLPGWITVEPRDVLLGLSALAFACAAAVAGYGQIMGFAEHARDGRKAGELFARAEERLQAIMEGSDEPEKVAAARRVLADLGREALVENGDWVILHRERPWEFTPV
jgi:hypothetical protein